MSAISLADTFFSRTRGSVFRELFASQEGLHLRELERRTGVNSRQLVRELHTLRDAGVLTPTRVGNMVLYRFNPDCPVYEEIQSLVRKTVGLADVLRNALEPFRKRIELAYIFGSFARGEQRSDSDVDLLIVGNVTRKELSTSIRTAGRILNREINTMIYASGEYAEAVKDSDSFLHVVHTGPRLNLDVDSWRESTGHASERPARSRASQTKRGQALP
jgi:predicted nucleotidyltransferase